MPPNVATLSHGLCRDIMPGLIDKLGDNKVAVRQANSKLLAVLMDVLQPGVVLDALSPALMHGNWRVREAAVNIIIQVTPVDCHLQQHPCRL